MSTQNSIRSMAIHKFNELLPGRVNSSKGNAAFRKAVVVFLVENAKCSWAAACTHYNHAFQLAKVAKSTLIEGLGRAEGKNNGGRKRKQGISIFRQPMPLLLGYSPNLSALLQAPLLPLLPEVVETPQTFTVLRCKDGEEVGTGLSKAEAEKLVADAKKAKKAKLMIKE